MHPDQETLRTLMETAGLERVDASISPVAWWPPTGDAILTAAVVLGD